MKKNCLLFPFSFIYFLTFSLFLLFTFHFYFVIFIKPFQLLQLFQFFYFFWTVAAPFLWDFLIFSFFTFRFFWHSFDAVIVFTCFALCFEKSSIFIYIFLKVLWLFFFSHFNRLFTDWLFTSNLFYFLNLFFLLPLFLNFFPFITS